jgi:hypothetical protein
MNYAIFLIFILQFISAYGEVNHHKVISLTELKATLIPIEDVSKNDKQRRLNSEILYIFDFDNTLMAMKQDLGSDQWYNWQSELLRNKNKKDAVASSQSELFEIQYKLYALGNMRPVEDDTASVVKSLQANGFSVIVLTSRGQEYRTDIEKELSSIDLNFVDSAIGKKGGILEAFLPEQVPDSKLVTYQNGILTGSGQNKGLLIKDLLKRVGYKPKKIIFFDDSQKNITNVQNEFKKSDILVHVVQYDAELSRVKKFENDKSNAIKHWKLLKPIFEFYKKVEK